MGYTSQTKSLQWFLPLVPLAIMTRCSLQALVILGIDPNRKTIQPYVVYFDELLGALCTQMRVELLFFSRFEPFLFISNLFQWFQAWNQQKTSEKEQKRCLLLKAGQHAKAGWLPEGVPRNCLFSVDKSTLKLVEIHNNPTNIWLKHGQRDSHIQFYSWQTLHKNANLPEKMEVPKNCAIRGAGGWPFYFLRKFKFWDK